MTTKKLSANDPTTRGLGWIPDLPDKRDRRMGITHAMATMPLPLNVDLRRSEKLPPVVDQGQTNSCVGHAIAALIDYLHPDPDYKTTKNPAGVFMPSSRRFIYWGARARQGWEHSDEGAYLRDGMKTLAEGAPHELACRFDEAKINAKPNPVAFTQASRRRKIAAYQRLDGVNAMQQCLAMGTPFVCGITVYTKFLSDDTAQMGEVNMPDLEREGVEGGHAICVVGYDLTAQRFIWRNSWGEGWGAGGYGTIPFAYLADADLADDFWTASI